MSQRIDPPAITGRETAAELIDQAFLAYNAARLKEGARLLTERMLQDDVTVALSVTGALTPAGLGMSAIIPLLAAGFVDWIVSTGANLYHDAHFGLGLDMHQGTFQVDDVVLREEGVVRIYDIFFDYKVLLDTDAFFREIISAPEFQRTMSSAEFHFLCGRYLRAREGYRLMDRREELVAKLITELRGHEKMLRAGLDYELAPARGGGGKKPAKNAAKKASKKTAAR